MYDHVPGPWAAIERYEFDCAGFIVLRGLIDADLLRHLNVIADERGPLVNNARPEPGGHFLDWDPAFRDLLVHPMTLGIIKELCGGDLVRVDNCYPIVQTAAKTGGLALHGGGSFISGDCYYVARNSKLKSGLTTVTFALTDQGGPLGGFCCIPGSHKSDCDAGDDLDVHHPIVVCPELAAGDAVVFTEALRHGTRPWTGAHERRALLLKYAPGMVAWGQPVLNRDRFQGVMDTDEQRRLFAIPSVERWAAPRMGYSVE